MIQKGCLLVFLFIRINVMGQSVSVMSYNIRLDTEVDGVNQWKHRSDRVVNLIQANLPDFLSVQEALDNQVKDLQRMLPDYAVAGVGRDDGKDKGEYSAIFYRKSRFKLVQQNTFWLSETPEQPGSKSWGAAITRIVTWIRVKEKATGKTFAVANTHFDHMGVMAREQSARLIKAKFNAYREALILTGDFNCEPGTAPYRILTNPEGLTLIDSRPSENQSGTYCGFDVGKMECRTIDYIFHSTDWQVVNYRVIDSNNGTFYPSDHLPVFVTLKWR